MSAGLLKAVRLILAIAFGSGLTYAWMSIRGETDTVLLLGIWLVSTLLSYILLQALSKN